MILGRSKPVQILNNGTLLTGMLDIRSLKSNLLCLCFKGNKTEKESCGYKYSRTGNKIEKLEIYGWEHQQELGHYTNRNSL